MKKIFIYLFICLASQLIAQEPAVMPGRYCGSSSPRTNWYMKYVADPQRNLMTKGSFTQKYVPMTVHVARRTNGTGTMNMMRMLDAFCNFQADFQGTDILFYLNNPEFDFVNEDLIYSHNTVDTVFNRLVALEVPHTFNSWIVNNAAGFCGYDLMCTGVAVGTGCMSGHTWAHEAGHFLNLKHPFHGWYGSNHNYALPAPDTLMFNWPFQYLCGGDFIPTDTVATELVSGTNCAYAADALCDTEPDYLWSRWNCNANGVSTQAVTDPTGVVFQTDASNFMSYSDDNCQSEFTAQQINLMHNYLQDIRPDLIQPAQPYTAITATPQLESPTANSVVQSGDVEFRWHSVPGATHYLLQIGRGSTVSILLNQFIVTDTSYTVNLAAAPFVYSWLVRPFNPVYACTTHSYQAFQAQDLASVEHLGGVFAEIYPNPTTEGNDIHIRLSGVKNQVLNYQIYHINGQIIAADNVNYIEEEVTVSMKNLPPGVYFIKGEIDGRLFIKKIVVQ